VADAPAQSPAAALRGRVLNELGEVVAGASVLLRDAGGGEKTFNTNAEGGYAVSGLAPGVYTLRVTAPGFSPYEERVEIADGARRVLDVTLRVTLEEERVAVEAEAPLSTDPENNAGTVRLRGSDLEALPSDSEDLAAALQAMAGPSAGPGGIQLNVDGFTNTGQPLPPRESIREVRINQNPFSAENDRLGFGRVDVLTRPGTNDLHGQAFFNFSDESLNSRNPFATNRAPYQTRLYGGSLSGRIVPKRASFFAVFERRDLDENVVVNATVLDPNLNPTQFARSVLTPRRRTSFSPRLDYQLSPNHTLVARYSYFRFTSENDGVGGFSLPERAFGTVGRVHTIQLTETAVINSRVLNEFRFQYIFEDRKDGRDSGVPVLNVQDAFVGGGPLIGPSINPEKRVWVQNNTTWTAGSHTLRAGARLRRSQITDVSPDNFNGTFIFSGGLAPQLDADNRPVRDAGGRVVLAPISSLEQYRRTLLFGRQGLTPAEIRARGGGPSLFSLATGDPRARISQLDFGAFLQDDWRVRPTLTLSLGLRFETQTNVGPHANFAPRVAFAWAPGAGAKGGPRTVIRGGFGIFYDRFAEGLVVNAARFDGVTVREFITSDPGVIDLFPNVPTVAALEASADSPQSVRRIAADLREPYTMQGAISIERQLPRRTTLTANFVKSRTLHGLRSRNVNAPLPGLFVAGDPDTVVRPLAGLGNVFQYESGGRLSQNQLIVNVNNRFSSKVTFFLNYTLNKLDSDTEGVQTFPADSYDLRTEYGPSSSDIRHLFFLGGRFQAPFGLNLSPFVLAFSGRPFNITTGRDTNGDTLFTDRPALAADPSQPGVVVTPFGVFDPDPGPGQQIIPRNFGRGPGYFTFNLTVNKTVGFGEKPGARGQAAPAAGAARNAEKRYSLTFGVQVINLFNRTNPDSPVGNLSSPFFGRSVASSGSFGFGSGSGQAGNRRVELQLRFGF
jgi:hypothetical protein